MRREEFPVRYELRDLPALLCSPLGRLQVLDDAIECAWPVLRGIAGLYRRTLIRTSRLVAVVGSFGKSTTARAVVVALGGVPHEPTPGRLQPVPLANGAVVLRDDYKAPLETIEAALEVLADIPAPRRIVVLGDVSEPMGSPRPIYRRVGERVAPVASQAIFVTGDNFSAYAAGAMRGGLPRSALIPARGGVGAVVKALEADLGPRDVVLVKGRRGQHLERIVLALMGWTVRCELKQCTVRLTACHKCPMLERGWEGRRVVV